MRNRAETTSRAVRPYVRVGLIELSTHRPRLTSLLDADIAWRSVSANADDGLAEKDVDAVVFHVGLEDGEDLGEAIRRAHERHPTAEMLLAAATGNTVALATILSVTPAPPSAYVSRLSLTAREVQVLSGIKAGLTNREIAQGLGTSLSTVNRHVENILLKLPARNRTQAAAAPIKLNGRSSPRSQPETVRSR